MKKITFIYPAIGKKKGQKYIRTWKMEPLPVATLAAQVPLDMEVEFFDDRLELIDYETNTDLVAINVETYTAQRAYYIASKFRERKIPVVLGGYHPSHMYEESIQHADAVVVGCSEEVFPTVIEDCRQKLLQKKYVGNPVFLPTLPRRDIFKGKKYLDLGLVETGRGCPHTCEFCHITTFYSAKYYPRPVADIIKDILQSGKKRFFFVDDNLVANPSHAISLFKELSKYNITWAGQGTLTMAKNPELLKWMKKSGCIMMLIGFESLELANLKQIQKEWSSKLGDTNELVSRIHDAGIGIYATFIFGFDHDTKATFEKTLAFAQKSKFFYAAFNHLLPFPGTPHYQQLVDQKRIIKPLWWLEEGYQYGEVVFEPAQMSPEELSLNCFEARKEFFSFSSIAKRGFSQLRRNTNLSDFILFLISNANLKEEVYGKYGLPVGKGLDELPK